MCSSDLTAGYQSELETAEDGAVQTVVWNAEDTGEPAPAFDLEVVATGETGDERYLAVFQGCENDSYRWIGTPDEPADNPAVRVTLAAADPAAPPPPEESPAAGPDTTAPADDPTTAPEEPDPTVTADEEPDPTVTADEEPTGDPEAAADDPADEQAEEPVGDEDGEGGTNVMAVIVPALLVLGIGVYAMRRRRGGSDDV